MYNGVELYPYIFTKAMRRHESQLEEVFLGQLSKRPEAYLLRRIRCHILLPYEDCDWLQGRDFLMWQSIIIQTPNNALGMDVTDTAGLQWT